jgi:hypothetical protein
MDKNEIIAFSVMNGVGLILGLIFGLGLYNHKSKISKAKGIMWGIGSFLACMIVFNGIIAFVEFMDQKRKESAFVELDERFESRGDENKESYKNLELVVSTEELKRTTYHNIYVANFNEKFTYHGKIKVKLLNKDEIIITEHTTESITIKPGEKKEINSFEYDKWYYTYSWRWLGELK